MYWYGCRDGWRPILWLVYSAKTVSIVSWLSNGELLHMQGRMETSAELTNLDHLKNNSACIYCYLLRCTLYSDCKMPDVSTRWLAYNTAQCIEITNVDPYDNLPITVTEQNVRVIYFCLPTCFISFAHFHTAAWLKTTCQYRKYYLAEVDILP